MDVLRTPDERFADLPDFAYTPHYLDHGILRQSTGCETKSSGGQEKPSGEHVNHSSRAPLPMKILLWEDGSGRGS